MSPLIEQHREELIALCRRHHVRRLEVFGSAAGDGFDAARSDVDLLVEFDSGIKASRFGNYFSLKRELESLLGRKVDLVEPGGIRNDHYRRGIDATRVPLYAA